MLETHHCSYRIGGKVLVRDVSILLEPGCVTALMGPNGAGKSTLVKLLSGQLRPSSGGVLIGGCTLGGLSPMQLGRQRAVLAQSRNVSFPFSAFNVVLFGRNPHAAGLRESLRDQAIAFEALQMTDAAHLRDRVYNTLSGGESARVDLARVIAQETDIILLDEPTNHLDPRHQVVVLQLCRHLAAEGKTVVVCLHDLNLCANYCDHVLLMKDGCVQAFGPPDVALTEAVLEMVYDIPFVIMRQPGKPTCILPLVRESCEADLMEAAV